MKRPRYGEFFPGILEEGVQHHNRVVTQEAIQEASHRYIREDYDENHNKYSQFDRDRLTRIIWAKGY